MLQTPKIVVVTLFSALWPIPIAILPIGTLIAAPRSSSPSGDAPDARLCDVFVSWVPGSDAPDPADTSGWRPRVEAALSNARDVGEMVGWLTEGANGISRDLSVEVVDADAITESALPDAPDSLPLATWLDAQALGVLGDHAALLCEVENLATVLA